MQYILYNYLTNFVFSLIRPRVLKKKPELKRQMSVSSLVLTWCQDVTKEYKVMDGIPVI